MKHSKETKEKIRKSSLGKSMSFESRKKMSAAKKGITPWNKGKKMPQFSGDKHPQWLDDKVGYSGIHVWVKKWKGKPNLCENCGTTTAKKFEWANIDHKYRRVLEDYIRMCTKCHRNYDRDVLGIKIGR